MEWWQAYLLTLVVEVPIVLAGLRAARIVGPRISWPRAVLLAWAVNLTHPVLWWIAPGGAGLLIAEVVIVVAEGMALWWVCRGDWPLRFYLVLAGLANGCSFLFGLLVTAML